MAKQPSRSLMLNALVQMRRNVRKQIHLKYSHYEIRTEANVLITTRRDRFDIILPIIKISYLRKEFIQQELDYELEKIANLKAAALRLEVFAVYTNAVSPEEYKRYLGELTFELADFKNYEAGRYSIKTAEAYYKQSKKSTFIPERV